MHEEKEFRIQEIEVRVEEDMMSAYITVSPVSEDKLFTVEELKEELKSKGVVYGIKEELLREIAEKKRYYTEFLISEGEAPVFGENGYYEIPFSFDFDKKPRINEDGSVDYNQFDDYCRVTAGDVIAVYKPATKGKNGVNIQGKKLFGKNGREQQPLRGKGFKIDENDNKKYIALMDGRLEYEENRTINISNLYEVDGDVNHATGNIQFPGDIHIKGNVTAGAVVKATGQIIVDGHVEASCLYAGQDIILKNGVQGAGKGRIESGGTISAKFFEQTVVRAKGVITAGAALNCDIESEEGVVISGRIGALIGGRVKAVSYIETNILGNMAETKTFVKVGGGTEMVADISRNDETISRIDEEIKRIDEAIEKIETTLKEKSVQRLTDKKMELIRAKYKKTSEMDKFIKTKRGLIELMEKSEKAHIMIHKSVYPGVSININDIVYINKSENFNVCYEKRGGNVIAVPNV